MHLQANGIVNPIFMTLFFFFFFFCNFLVLDTFPIRLGYTARMRETKYPTYIGSNIIVLNYHTCI